jgi:hypothetical protein
LPFLRDGLEKEGEQVGNSVMHFYIYEIVHALGSSCR